MTQGQQITRIETLGDFYVPAFEIVLDDDRSVPENVLRDITDVTYRDSVDDLDEFDITICNWDPDAHSFRYLGGEGEEGDETFAPGRRLSIYMGYGDDLVKMIDGQITRLEPDFPQSGNATLRISGLNEIHRFRREQHTWAWFDRTDSQIALEIGQNPVHRERPGIDFRVVAPRAREETAEPFVQMVNEHDIVFLLRRARRLGYVLALRRPEEGEPYLHFGPQVGEGPADAAPPPRPMYELRWGATLVSFGPELTTANQLWEVTVRGWDRRTRRPIVGTATRDDLDLNADQTDVARAVEGRREVVHLPVRSRRDAENRAEAILRRNAEDLITGKGRTIGLPHLRAGEKVLLTGLGPRFSGRYFVTSTTHTIGSGGYVTEFNARRESEAEGEAT